MQSSSFGFAFNYLTFLAANMCGGRWHGRKTKVLLWNQRSDRIGLDWSKTCEFEGTDARSGSMMEHHFAPHNNPLPQHPLPQLSPPEYQTRFILIALFISSFSFAALTPASLESTLTNGASDAWCEWPTYHQPHNPYTPLPLLSTHSQPGGSLQRLTFGRYMSTYTRI